MGLEFAIDELYGSGWTGLDTAGCEHHADGRVFPTVERVKREFAEAGHELSLRRIQLFDCYRAEWKDAQGQPAGAVVGHTESEAAVYALSQFRRRALAGQAH